MALSQRTLDEMTAGASALASHQGRQLPGKLDAANLLEGLKSVQERMAAIRRWERAGLLTIERKRLERLAQYADDGLHYEVLHHVKNGPTLAETPEALLCGGYPSELLTAQIALAISSCGGEHE